MSDAYKCVACSGSMSCVVGGPKHLYECDDTKCRARAVITPKGTTDEKGEPEVFRYNLPPVGEWPSMGETPRPKDAASFALRSGKGETIASMPGGLMRAVASAIHGGPTTAVDIVNEMLPAGVKAVDDGSGNLTIEGSDHELQKSESGTPSVDRGVDGEEDDAY